MALPRLRELAPEMQKCFRCSLCKMVPLPTVLNPKYSDGCPSSRQYHFHGYSGSGKNIMALSLVDGRIKVDQTLADITFACTACGLCDVSCKFIMEAERHSVNMALREHIVEEGFAPPAHRAMIKNLEETGLPRGRVGVAARDWARDLGLKMLPDRAAPVLLFAGCLQCGDPTAADVARKLARLLQQSRVDFGVLRDGETSCGLPAYWTGHREVFTRMANRVADLLDATKAQTVVTVSGSCLGALRSKYPEYARAPKARVLHATEFLAQLIKDGRLHLSKSVRRKVTYHDPCYLGRQSEPPLTWEGEYKVTHGCMTYTDPPKEINRGVNGVYEPPRQILRAIKGLDFVEMYRIREYSYCCGGGGGVPLAYPDLALSAAIDRLEEAKDVGAECLVTACHHCRANLSKPQHSLQQPLIPVVDIIDLVCEAADLE
ncbi:MAG: (Fe-S)-binding protein [Dehalococcoidia bacterium]|nr:(Fe-S)-binding protein [Dehalococcoidia bacterium]